MSNRRLVPWVRLTFCAVGIAIAISLLSFIFIARGGGENWRTLFRLCFWFGWLATLLLYLGESRGRSHGRTPARQSMKPSVELP